MGVCLVLYSISDDDAELIRSDPPLIWLLLGEPDAYIQAKTRAPSLIDRILRRKPEPPPEPPHVDFAQGESDWCDIDKSWHALHFLLTGSSEPIDSPLSFLAESGPNLCRVEIGYGPPAYRSAQEVQDFAAALQEISRGEIESRFDADRLNANGIYHEGWSQDEDHIEYIGAHYEALSEWVSEVARNRKGVVLQYT